MVQSSSASAALLSAVLFLAGTARGEPAGARRPRPLNIQVGPRPHYLTRTTDQE